MTHAPNPPDPGVDARAWPAAAGGARPARIVVADDTLGAAGACRLAAEGTAILWRGDYHNARQLLDAMARRLDARARRPRGGAAPAPAEAFHRWRLAQAQRAQQLSRLLVPVDPGWVVPLRRAPELAAAAAEAFGALDAPAMMPLRALLGAIGAAQWRLRGIELPVLGPAPEGPGPARIHPHYGVFAPVRNEYLDLVAAAPLPAALAGGGPAAPAFDLGAGTGVIAALLARRGVARIVATDASEAALACAADNLRRLRLDARVELRALASDADPYPPGRAALVVCNPPWLPGKPTTALEHGVFDPGGRMLAAFLAGLGAHLVPGGEGWLLMSDLAERLGLRPPGALERAFADAGLRVLGHATTRPRHPKSRDADDPLAAARGAEIVSLWRLAPVGG